MGRKRLFTNRKVLTTRQNKFNITTSSSATSTSIDFKTLKDELQANTSSLLDGWFLMEVNSLGPIVLCNIEMNAEKIPKLSYSIIIAENFSCTINAFSRNNISLPKSITISCLEDVTSMVTYVSSLSLCPGNADECYLLLAHERDGHFKNKQGKT